MCSPSLTLLSVAGLLKFGYLEDTGVLEDEEADEEEVEEVGTSDEDDEVVALLSDEEESEGDASAEVGGRPVDGGCSARGWTGLGAMRGR